VCVVGRERAGLSGPWPGMWTPLWCSRRRPVCQSCVAGRRLQRPPCGRRAVPAVRVTTARCIGTPAPGADGHRRVRSAAGRDGGMHRYAHFPRRRGPRPVRVATARCIGTPARGGRRSRGGEVCCGSRRRDASVRPLPAPARAPAGAGRDGEMHRYAGAGGRWSPAGEVCCDSRRRDESARPHRRGLRPRRQCPLGALGRTEGTGGIGA
jgi:hypothetical protein